MQKLKILFFLIFIIIFLSCSSDGQNLDTPVAKDGILDLRNWDLVKDGPVKLNGEWNFFWERFVPPETINDQPNPSKIKVPSIWSSQKINNKHLNKYGYATYHLRILLNPIDNPLGLKFGTVGSAYEVYINGKKINQVGKVGKSHRTMEGRFRPGIIDFTFNSNELDLVLYVSSFHQKKSGLRHPTYFGQSRDLTKLREKIVFFNYALFGVFLIMFFYHIGLFILRPDDKVSFYLALYCFFIAIRVTSTSSGEIILLNFFPYVSMDWIKTIDYLTFYLCIPTAALFIYELFPNESNKTFFYIFSVPTIIISIITLVTSAKVFTHLMIYIQVIALVLVHYILYINIRAMIKKRDGAVILFTGIFIMVIATINDIFNSIGLIRTFNFIPTGFFILVFCQSLVLSSKFARSFFTIEKLSSTLKVKNIQLQDLNQNLEKKVEKRTEELVSAKNKLWAEMEVAKKIQTVLLPKKAYIQGFQISSYMLPTEAVGGDYYDIINSDINDWILIGDVSGHGVPAGLIMMMAQSTVRSYVMVDPTIKPSELLENISSAICYNIKNMEEQKFMTITALSYNKKNEIIFSGRHEDILVYRVEKDDVEIIRTSGICISEMSFGEKNINLNLQVNQGDTILLYTDGLIEAWEQGSEATGKGKMFGQEKVINILKKTGKLSSEEIKESFLKELQDYSLDDDVTFIILKKL